MKRASEVPPLVESAGAARSTSSTASRDEIGEGAARGQEGDRVGRIEGRASQRAPPAAARRRAARFRPRSVSGDHESLKRMLKTSRTSPGMTLAAGLPTSTLTISRLEGSKSGVPAIERRRLQRGQDRRQARGSDCRARWDRRRGPACRAASAGRSASRAGRSSSCRRAPRRWSARRACNDRTARRARSAHSSSLTVPLTAGPSSSPVTRKLIEPWNGAARDEAQRGGDRRGDAALHVAGAAAPDHAVGDRRRERIEPPSRGIARRHDVGMAGKDEIRRRPCRSARRDCRRPARRARRRRRSRRRSRRRRADRAR